MSICLESLHQKKITVNHITFFEKEAIFLPAKKSKERREEAFYCIKSFSFAQAQHSTVAPLMLGSIEQQWVYGIVEKQKGEREMLRQIAEVFLECYTAFECMKRALLVLKLFLILQQNSKLSIENVFVCFPFNLVPQAIFISLVLSKISYKHCQRVTKCQNVFQRKQYYVTINEHFRSLYLANGYILSFLFFFVIIKEIASTLPTLAILAFSNMHDLTIMEIPC